MQAEQDIVVEVEESIAHVILNHPDTGNALDATLCDGLYEALERVQGDAAVRALVLTAAGETFCAGPKEAGPGETVALNRVLTALRDCRVPVVVAINGPAIGAGNLLALAGDWLLASGTMVFEQLPATVIAADMLGLPGYLPPSVNGASSMTAAQACEAGLVTECLEAEHLLPRALEMAQELAQGPTRALAETRRLVDEGFANSFEQQCRRELEVNQELRESHDGREGVQAFLEKRPACFKGS